MTRTRPGYSHQNSSLPVSSGLIQVPQPYHNSTICWGMCIDTMSICTVFKTLTVKTKQTNKKVAHWVTLVFLFM